MKFSRLGSFLGWLTGVQISIIQATICEADYPIASPERPERPSGHIALTPICQDPDPWGTGTPTSSATDRSAITQGASVLYLPASSQSLDNLNLNSFCSPDDSDEAVRQSKIATVVDPTAVEGGVSIAKIAGRRPKMSAGPQFWHSG